MNTISPEQLQSVTEIEGALVARATESLSQSLDAEIQFQNPLIVTSRALDAISEFSGNAVILRFQFDDATPQFVVLTTDLATAIASLGSDTTVVLDPEDLEPVKPRLQAIVSALADGFASALGMPIVPSGFDVTLGGLEFPDGYSDAVDLLRIQAGLSGQVSGTITWLLHPATVAGLFPNAATVTVEHPETKQAKADLEVLLDVPLTISVELGRVSMKVQEVIDLGAGSIIEIDKAAGEPIDILVNGRLVARGEVVVVEDNFGVRVTEILSPKDRVLTLGEAA